MAAALLTGSLMHAVIVGLALALALVGAAASADAEPLSDEGTLTRLDPPSRVVTLEDGRMYRAIAGTSFVVESRTETFDRLRPGVRIVVIGGEPVVYRQGRYIALPALPPSLGVAVAPSPPSGVTVAPPPPSVVLPTTAPSPAVSAGIRWHDASPPASWRPAATMQPPSHIFPPYPFPTTQSSP